MARDYNEGVPVEDALIRRDISRTKNLKSEEDWY